RRGPMELFTKLFGSLLVLVYHCFDRIVIHGYLSALTRPEPVVYFFRQVVGVEAVDKEVLSRRTGEYQDWVEAFARNHHTPIEWAEKGVRKDDYVQRWLRSMARGRRHGAPHPRRAPQPLHPLLLLHSRRDLGAHRHARSLFLSVPNHLLSQRPLVHRAGAQSSRHRLSQARQRVRGGCRSGCPAGRSRPAESRAHPRTPRLLDAAAGAEVLHQRAQPAEAAPLPLPPH